MINSVKNGLLCLLLGLLLFGCELGAQRDVDGVAQEDSDSPWTFEGSCVGDDFELPEGNYNDGSYALTSLKAQMLAGSDEIYRRSQCYYPDVDALPRIEFSEYSDEDVEARLIEVCSALLELGTEPTVEDRGDTFTLSEMENGGGFCFKESMQCYCYRNDNPAGSNTAGTVTDAIDAALASLAELDILQLGIHETLDLVSSSFNQSEQTYRLNFGRRYKGVPMVEGTLAVEVSRNGFLESITTGGWRHALKELDPPAVLLKNKDREALRNSEYAEYPIVEMKCGHMLGYSGIAGAACELLYFVESQDDSEDYYIGLCTVISREISPE